MTVCPNLTNRTTNTEPYQDRGFSMVELLVVTVILLVLSAISLPQILVMIHTARLRGAASDFGGIAQTDRIRAVQDATFYSVDVVGQTGFVDLNRNSAFDTGEPSISISSEVTLITAATAPDTAVLKSQFLPAGSAPLLYDGNPAAGTPITFGSRGLPCTTQTATTGTSTGTVCESAGGATAFWVFFQDAVTKDYVAVTITPSGRIQRWFHSTGAWNAA